jgi:hypothetical protein
MPADRTGVMSPRFYTSVRTGDGMRRAGVISALMKAIQAEALAFAEAHPAGLCRCPLCRTCGIVDMRRDIVGIGWACEITRGSVSNFFPVADVDADELRAHVRDLIDREVDEV